MSHTQSTGEPDVGDVCVWVLDVGGLVASAEQQAGILDDWERGRWRRLRRGEDRDRFIVAHVACRRVLASLLHVPPGEVELDRRCRHCGGSHGKPRPRGSATDVSISHAGAFALVAAVGEGAVGVDVETIGAVAHDEMFIDRHFSPEEGRRLRSTPAAARRQAVARGWVAKEACAKAVGLGLAVPFSSFSVGPDGPHPLDPAIWATDPWSLHAVSLDGDHVAAVAVSPARQRLWVASVSSFGGDTTRGPVSRQPASWRGESHR